MFAVREAIEQFLLGDAPTLADELTDALRATSAHVARFRERIPNRGPLAEDMNAVENAFAHSIALTQRLSVAIRANGDPGACAATAGIARELGRRLASAMPEGTAFTAVCPSSPALAAMPPPRMRRVLATLVRRLVDRSLDRGGDVVLEVEEVTEATSPSVRIVVGSGGLPPGAAADAADDVRPHVNACGGSVEPCARPGGGASVVVVLPRVCR